MMPDGFTVLFLYVKSVVSKLLVNLGMDISEVHLYCLLVTAKTPNFFLKRILVTPSPLRGTYTELRSGSG